MNNSQRYRFTPTESNSPNVSQTTFSTSTSSLSSKVMGLGKSISIKKFTERAAKKEREQQEWEHHALLDQLATERAQKERDQQALRDELEKQQEQEREEREREHQALLEQLAAERAQMEWKERERERELEEQQRKHWHRQSLEAEERMRERERESLEAEERMRERERERLQRLKMNTPESLRELRELIRERYALDMEIWRQRTVRRPDRYLVEEKMRKADEILFQILERVSTWEKGDMTADNGYSGEGIWDDHAWELAEEIKRRLGIDEDLEPNGGVPRHIRKWEGRPPWNET